MRRNEKGSGTVLMMLGLTLLVPVVMGGFTAAHLVLVHRATAAAADLSALAAATALGRGGDPCRVASDLATRNGATVVECRVVRDRVSVSVRAEVAVPFGIVVPVTATAAAGPGFPPGSQGPADGL